MTDFESKYFQKTSFSKEQLANFLNAAVHDLEIAKASDIPDVVFKFSYDALIKTGIALIAEEGYKVRSSAGHHVMIIEKLSVLLNDNDIMILGNKMRQDRNANLYEGIFYVSEKNTREYLAFVKLILAKAEKKIRRKDSGDGS